MRSILFRRHRSAGRSPGTVEYAGEVKVPRPRLSALRYTADEVEDVVVETPEQCRALRDQGPVVWINLEGLHDSELVRGLGQAFGIHPLVLEDIVTTTQRPKVEDHDDNLFLVLRMLTFDDASSEVHSEQVSLILMRGCVLTFQESVGDCWNPVRERIRRGKGRIRQHGADYLSYALADAIVDNYFLVLEQIAAEIEALETSMSGDIEPEQLRQVHHLRREMVLLRKAVWPLREVVATLQRSDSPLIDDQINIYLRDVYDHAVQVIETTEAFRDVLSSLQDLYLSNATHRMNEVMKVLTIISTVFIPLSFLASVYGMNFEKMPELGWRFGYGAFWLAIGVVAIGLLIFFRRRRWF